MELLTHIGLLVVGFAVLILGGEGLVRSAVALAIRWKISPAVIGLTIIAAGTSMPELVTSITASFKNAPDIALGNVVGSNIFNMLAILGVASLLAPNKVSPSTIKRDLPFLLVGSISVITFAQNGWIERWEGILLLVALTGFLIFSFKIAKKQGNLDTSEVDEVESLKNVWMELGLLTIGMIALLGGANIALESGIAIGQFFGLSERIIGVTIIAVGTGLPELATSSVAAYRGRNDIAVSNVIGSNIMNTMAILGTASTIRPMAASEKIITSDCAWMAGSILIVFPILFLGKGRIGRTMGAFLLFCYVSYIGFLLSSP